MTPWLRCSSCSGPPRVIVAPALALLYTLHQRARLEQTGPDPGT